MNPATLTLEYRTDHRLSDALALQMFMLRHHLLKRALFVAVCMFIGLVIATLMNGAPLSDSLADLARNAGFYVEIFVIGLLAIQAVTLVIAMLAWRRRPKPREIRAAITPDGVTLFKDGFSYGARWADADFLTKTKAAYLIKFHQLYMRLPRRGFGPGQEAAFLAMVRPALGRGADKIRRGA